jgi:hypothetical protein
MAELVQRLQRLGWDLSDRSTAGTINVIGSSFVWAGAIIVLWCAWVKRLEWCGMLRFAAFWLGIALAVAGKSFITI